MELIILYFIGLAMGYVGGLFQKGINITIKHGVNEEKAKKGYNRSVGIPDYMEYHKETNGMNKF